MTATEKLPVFRFFTRASARLTLILAAALILLGIVLRVSLTSGHAVSEIILILIPLASCAAMSAFVRFTASGTSITDLPLFTYFCILIVGTVLMLLDRFGYALTCAGYAFALYAERSRGIPGVIKSFLLSLPLAALAVATRSINHCLVYFAVVGCVTPIFALAGGFGTKRRTYALCFTALILLLGTALCLIFFDGATMQALIVTLSPRSDPFGNGYYLLAVREALAGAALWGAGSSSAIMLPTSRFLLTCTAAEFGLIPFALIILATLVMLAAGFAAAYRKQSIHCLLSLCCMAALTLHSLLYIAQNLGLIYTNFSGMPFLCESYLNIEHYMMLSYVLLGPDGRRQPRRRVSRGPAALLSGRLSSLFSLLSLRHAEGLVCEMLALPREKWVLERLLCSGDDAISVSEQDIDRAISGRQMCMVWRFRGDPDELFDRLRHIHFDCDTVFFRVIGSEFMTPMNISRLTDSLTETCDAEAEVHFNIGLYDDMSPDECTVFIFAI